MRLTYDATTDVAYLSLRDLLLEELLGPTLFVETDPEFPGFVALDFSLADGRAVGLELERASACMPAELLATAERRDGPCAPSGQANSDWRCAAGRMAGSRPPR